MTGPVLVGQFWGLDSDRILKLVLREIILFQEIQMPQAAAAPWAMAYSNSFRLRSPAPASHLFRHQMLTYLTSKGLTDAQIQLISGHESKKSLEVYQHLSLESVDKAY